MNGSPKKRSIRKNPITIRRPVVRTHQNQAVVKNHLHDGLLATPHPSHLPFRGLLAIGDMANEGIVNSPSRHK